MAAWDLCLLVTFQPKRKMKEYEFTHWIRFDGSARRPPHSDLTDAEWEVLRPLIPGPSKLGRPPRYEKRAILNAIFHMVRSGCSWRMLPGDPAGAAQLLPEVVCRFGRVRHFWADRTYSSLKIMDQLQEWFPQRGLRLEVVHASRSNTGRRLRA